MPPRRRLSTSTILVLLAAVALVRPAAGQEPDHANWRFLTSADGLVESWTFDATRGPSGRLFISHGEVGQISVFDGYRMHRLPSPGPYLTVREGSDGMLWALLRRGGVGNFVYIGVQRLEGRRWVAYPLAESLGPGETSISSSSRAFLPVERDRVLIVGAGRLLDCRIRQGALEAQHPDLGAGVAGAVRFLVPARPRRRLGRLRRRHRAGADRSGRDAAHRRSPRVPGRPGARAADRARRQRRRRPVRHAARQPRRAADGRADTRRRRTVARAARGAGASGLAAHRVGGDRPPVVDVVRRRRLVRARRRHRRRGVAAAGEEPRAGRPAAQPDGRPRRRLLAGDVDRPGPPRADAVEHAARAGVVHPAGLDDLPGPQRRPVHPARQRAAAPPRGPLAGVPAAARA